MIGKIELRRSIVPGTQIEAHDLLEDIYNFSREFSQSDRDRMLASQIVHAHVLSARLGSPCAAVLSKVSNGTALMYAPCIISIAPVYFRKMSHNSLSQNSSSAMVIALEKYLWPVLWEQHQSRIHVNMYAFIQVCTHAYTHASAYYNIIHII